MTSSGTLWLGAFFWAIAPDTAMVLHQIVSITIVVINVMFMSYLFLILGKDAYRDYGVADRLAQLARIIQYRSLSWGSTREQRSHNIPGGEDAINAKDGTSCLGSDGRGQRATAAAEEAEAAESVKGTDEAAKGEKVGPEHLPTRWVKLMDERTGFTYYSNTLTGEVQWTCPLRLVAAETVAAGHQRRATDLPAGWQRILSQEGKPYYVSAAGISQWEKPRGNEQIFVEEKKI